MGIDGADAERASGKTADHSGGERPLCQAGWNPALCDVLTAERRRRRPDEMVYKRTSRVYARRYSSYSPGYSGLRWVFRGEIKEYRKDLAPNPLTRTLVC